MLVLNAEAARELAAAEITRKERPGLEPIILDDKTREYKAGWLFFWDNKKYVETMNVRFAVGGNLPIFVSRDGAVKSISTRGDWEENLKNM